MNLKISRLKSVGQHIFQFLSFLQYVSVFFLSVQCINILIYVKFSTIKPLGYYNITNRAPTYQQVDVNLRLVFPPMHCYLRSLDSSVEIRLISNLPMKEYRQL